MWLGYKDGPAGWIPMVHHWKTTEDDSVLGKPESSEQAEVYVQKYTA